MVKERERRATVRMALPNLSHLRPGAVAAVVAVGAPTSPKRAATGAPDNKLWDE